MWSVVVYNNLYSIMKVYFNLTIDFLRRNLWTFVFLFYQTFLVYLLAINAANGDVKERVIVNLLWALLSIMSVSFLNTKLKNWFISIIPKIRNYHPIHD